MLITMLSGLFIIFSSAFVVLLNCLILASKHYLLEGLCLGNSSGLFVTNLAMW